MATTLGTDDNGDNGNKNDNYNDEVHETNMVVGGDDNGSSEEI